MQLTGDGKMGNEKLEGNEESLATYSDSLTIDQLRHAVRVAGEDSIDQQRVLFNLRTEAKDGLKDWFAKRMSVSFFNQVCGNTAQTDTKFTGLNAVTAPASARHIWTESGTTADEDLDSTGDTMTLAQIDYAKELAQTADPQIRPVKVNGEDKYVLYLHPYQVTDLRTNTSTGQWLDIQKSALAGGMVENNPIYTGALGEYNGVILRWSHDVATGVNSSTAAAITTVRRAVLLGAQAAMIGFGAKRMSDSYKWVEKDYDYENEVGIKAGTLMGLKKCIFNSLDFGAIVISSYAVAHTS